MVFGGLAYSYEIHALIVYGFAGIFIGAVMAPEIEPKYFKHPKIWQTASSLAGCILFAYNIEALENGYVLAIIIGLFLGTTASFWVKHVTFP